MGGGFERTGVNHTGGVGRAVDWSKRDTAAGT